MKTSIVSMCRKVFLVYNILFYFTWIQLDAQCLQEGAFNCEDAFVFCSLDELDGYKCYNTEQSNPTACLPCNGYGAPHNSSWWAFVSEGGEVSITIIFDFCYNPGGGQPSGAQYGIVSQCDCSGQVACHSNCNTYGDTAIIKAFLIPCRTYYLWLDGCNGDVCHFTIKTSGGKKPNITQLGNINSSIPNPLYTDCCVDFTVTPPSNNCQPFHVWTVDGKPYWCSYNSCRICFPQAGTFSVCVHSVIGNPLSGSLCSAQTPAKCISVVVKQKLEARAKPLILCPDQIPFRWHCQLINQSGTYRCPFNLNGCYELDSVIDITVINKSPVAEIVFIGCKGEIYKDTIRSYPTCNNKTQVFIPSKIHACDSPYILTTFYPTETGMIDISCLKNNFLLSAKIKNTTELCGLNPIIADNMEWYDSLRPQNILGTGDSLIVVSPSRYCVRHSVNYSLGNVSKQCSYKYCVNLLDNFFTIQDIVGKSILENGSIEPYKVKNNSQNINLFTNVKYLWSVINGVILDSFPEKLDSINIRWNDAPFTLGRICVQLQSDCVMSNLFCKVVQLKMKTAVEDNERTTLLVVPNPSNGNFMIINYDSEVQLDRIKLISVEGKEIKFQVSNTGKNQFEMKIIKATAGVYQLQIQTKKGMMTKSIIVEK